MLARFNPNRLRFVILLQSPPAMASARTLGAQMNGEWPHSISMGATPRTRRVTRRNQAGLITRSREPMTAEQGTSGQARIGVTSLVIFQN